MTEPVSRLSSTARSITLLVTNAIKIGGLAVALNEAFNRPQPRIAEMGLAIFMMAGAQISEETILSLAGRLFGAHPAEEKSKERT